MSIPFSFENKSRNESLLFTYFNIYLLCFKYFYAMFMFSMRSVSDSLSYYMIYTKIKRFKKTHKENENTNNKQNRKKYII